MANYLNQAARLVIRITNPIFLGPLLLAVVVFSDSRSTLILAEEATALFFLLIAIPLGYVLFRMRAPGSGGDPTTYLKRHPFDILALEVVCGLPCWFILTGINAPPLAINILTALIATACITAIINFFYRASFHLAAFTVLFCMVVVRWGPLFFLLVLIVPLIAWAKYLLREHTPMQLLTGTVLGAAIGLLIIIFTR